MPTSSDTGNHVGIYAGHLLTLEPDTKPDYNTGGRKLNKWTHSEPLYSSGILILFGGLQRDVVYLC